MSKKLIRSYGKLPTVVITFNRLFYQFFTKHEHGLAQIWISGPVFLHLTTNNVVVLTAAAGLIPLCFLTSIVFLKGHKESSSTPFQMICV